MNTQFEQLTVSMERLEQANVELHTRMNSLETRSRRERRRLRIQAGLAFTAFVAATFAIPGNRAAIAQAGGVTLASLNTRLLVVESKTQYMSVDTTAKKTTFSGCNVVVSDGGGANNVIVRNAAGEGLGNLTIGYNTLRGSGDNRTGSHNLIVGDYQNYSSYSGFVAGRSNAVNGTYASISGGVGNTASGNAASISGGYSNTVSGDNASVSGGYYNAASSNGASVSGGQYNVAKGLYSAVSGGVANIASGWAASVSGGDYNTAYAYRSSISGGEFNSTGGDVSSISGGQCNLANGALSSISGGYYVQQNAGEGWAAGGSGSGSSYISGTFHSP